MQHRTLLSAALPVLIVAGLMATAPSAGAQTVIIAPTAPPPVRVETIPAAPSPTMAWQAGHWTYDGTQWVWTAGQHA